jgi:hypothetical protein
LTITRVLSPEDKASEHEHEPYLVQLHPGRPVPANAPKPEIGFQDMMRVMRDVADRIDGIAWESGREAR